MHIYFSGIGGVGIGPLAQIAFDAGYKVSGSDLSDSLMTEQLKNSGIDVSTGLASDENISIAHTASPIDWFVHTAALPADHPELVFAKNNGIRTSKRDELLAEIIKQKDLKLVAISGTHGKTTTTGMLVWTLQQLGVPVSYSVGSQISFGPSGKFDPNSQYFVYECDEFDRNMLHFEPHLSLITSLDHDHFDTYPTVNDYRQAFVQFIEQSDFTLLWSRDLRYLEADPAADIEAYDELMDLSRIQLAGDHNRHNAYLVERAVTRLLPDTLAGGDTRRGSAQNSSQNAKILGADRVAGPAESKAHQPEQSSGEASVARIINTINSFPGTARRMEKLADNLYSDYGHHPAEIAATLQLAREINDHAVLVYQPHQNIRQHEVRSQYTDSMELAEKIYWLPTYLSREKPNLEVLTPQQLSENLSNRQAVSYLDLNDDLWKAIQSHLSAGHLVLCMGAGSIDGWLRQKLSKS